MLAGESDKRIGDNRRMRRGLTRNKREEGSRSGKIHTPPDRPDSRGGAASLMDSDTFVTRTLCPDELGYFLQLHLYRNSIRRNNRIVNQFRTQVELMRAHFLESILIWPSFSRWLISINSQLQSPDPVRRRRDERASSTNRHPTDDRLSIRTGSVPQARGFVSTRG